MIHIVGATWRRVTIVLLLCAFVAPVSGCSKGSTARPYALLDNPAWKLTRAVDPPAGSTQAKLERPRLDWYDEYEYASGRVTQVVRISGHTASLEETEALLVGFTFRAATVKGWRAVRGSTPGDGSPALLVLDRGSSVLIVLSYELPIDDLERLASQITLVDRSAWTRAGGVVQ